MLRLERKSVYMVKSGQTLREIANAFCVSPRLIAKLNCLKEEPRAGDILLLPSESGNTYTAKEGDTKILLCGSEENFERKNGTGILYLGMKVIL